MIYDVSHVSRIRYDAMVRLAQFNLRLQPASWPGQTVYDYRLTITPTPVSIETHEGAHIVNVTRLAIDEPLIELVIDSRFRVSVDDAPWLAMAAAPTVGVVVQSALLVQDLGKIAPGSYLFASPHAPHIQAIADWAASELAHDRPVVEVGLALAQRIKAEFAYEPGVTDIGTPAARAFDARHGVCQDFAHIMIIALRSAGLPAAYVSGYLRTFPPPGKPRLIGSDATHAWVMLWCGNEMGWTGFDPTNGCMAGPDHIFTAMGRDYGDVSPIDGVFRGHARQHLDIAVDVLPIS